MSKVDVSGKCPKRNNAHPTEAAALQALLDVKIRRGLRYGGRSRENGAYKCPICPHAWHLTSKAVGLVRWVKDERH